MDYSFTKISAYDGTARKVTVVEVFNTVTGQPITFCHRRAYEPKEAWVARAMSDAEQRIAA